mmetsp:Transcript_109375/g.211772  ORF Transcript_109375/g.211772 Transcript_109375/m.211772 type:complete len:502 (+) Transcript_109375:53-1558(+)
MSSLRVVSNTASRQFCTLVVQQRATAQQMVKPRDAGEMFGINGNISRKQLRPRAVERHFVTKLSHYQRELPNGHIPFSCPEGRSLFQQALSNGQMETYFYMAEQFQTQAEPTYCGLATLAMVLNALRVDPMRAWKGSWRWFTEENLGCGCITQKSVEHGMAMQVLASLADCNGAATEVMYAPRASHDSEDAKQFADFFRETVRETCSSGERRFLIASYSRGFLGQTGDGHFSPIGGYHEESDSVLIMDVARFKYPPHWAPLKDLASAMLLPDSETGEPRGFMRLSAHPKTQAQQISAPQKPLEVRYLPKAAGQWIAGSLLEKLAENQLHHFNSWSTLALSRWLSAVQATSPGILGKIVVVDDMDLFMGIVQQIYSRSELFRELCRSYAELQALGFDNSFPPLRIHDSKLDNCQSPPGAPQTCGELWILFLLLLPQHLRAAVSEHLAHPDLSSEICKMVRCPWALPMEALKETLHFALPAKQSCTWLAGDGNLSFGPQLLWQ